MDQIQLSLKGIVRVLEALLSLDFYSLRNSIERLTKARV